MRRLRVSGGLVPLLLALVPLLALPFLRADEHRWGTLALIAATTAAFWRIRRVAGLLLLPYLAWVSFASVLTWAVWQRNPGLL